MVVSRATTGLVAVAAGGTGGHVFPALALGQELVARGHEVALITDARGAAYGGAEDIIARHVIAAGHLSGTVLRRLGGGLRLAQGLMQSAALLRRLEPIAVVGFGGYPSLPVMIAARKRYLTIVHEQNALLGLANRIAARRAAAVALSVAETAGVPPEATTRTRLIGNPVRAEIAALAGGGYDAPTDAVRILVTGGSQGATIFSDTVPHAVARLDEALRGRVRVTQQARPGEADTVRAAYAAAGVSADVVPFVTDMAAALRDAHLVICRAGASTVAELTVAGRPGILVPLPSAAGDHQTANGRALELAGAGWVAAQNTMTADSLGEMLAGLLTAPAKLQAAADAAAALAQPAAATRLADLIIDAVASAAVEGGHSADAAAGDGPHAQRMCEVAQ